MARFEPVANKRLLASQYTWFLLWLAVTLFAVFLRPSPHGHGTHTQLGLASCPSVSFFDRPCPGCGLTTSWTRLVQGDVGGSFKAHALGPPLYALFTVSAIGGLAAALKKLRFVSGDRMNWGIAIGFGLFMLYGVIRFATVTYGSVHYLFRR